MPRSKQEVRNWLDSKVGYRVADMSDARLNGQCVALIKALMEFLGVQNPYAARGNAKDAGDTYLRQGIANNGTGWLTIVVNRSMGLGYGHIWVDLANEANYEQNGAKALSTTKNTRPYNQGQQYINFDKWITPDAKPTQPTQGGNTLMTPNFIKRVYQAVQGRDPSQGEIDFHMQKSSPESFINGFGDAFLWKTKENEKNAAIKERDTARNERDKANTDLKAANDKVKKLEEQVKNNTGTGSTVGGEFTKVFTAGADLYTKK